MYHTVRSIYIIQLKPIRVGDSYMPMLNQLHWADVSYLVNNKTLPARAVQANHMAQALLNRLCDDR